MSCQSYKHASLSCLLSVSSLPPLFVYIALNLSPSNTPLIFFFLPLSVFSLPPLHLYISLNMSPSTPPPLFRYLSLSLSLPLSLSRYLFRSLSNSQHSKMFRNSIAVAAADRVCHRQALHDDGAASWVVQIRSIGHALLLLLMILSSLLSNRLRLKMLLPNVERRALTYGFSLVTVSIRLLSNISWVSGGEDWSCCCCGCVWVRWGRGGRGRWEGRPCRHSWVMPRQSQWLM